jgi:hypothetical protein
MSIEQSPRSEHRGTLLQTVEPERLIRLAEGFTRLKAIDRIYEIVQHRIALDKLEKGPEVSLENHIALDRISFLREVIFQNTLIEVDVLAPDDEAIAFEEAINEALFRPFGEEK